MLLDDPYELHSGQWRVCPAPTRDAKGLPIPAGTPIHLLRQLAPGRWECEAHLGVMPTLVILPAEQLQKWPFARI